MSEHNQVTMDNAGRIVIPKAIRARLGLSPGAILIAEEHDHQEILLRPLRQASQLTDKGGILVVQSQAVGNIFDAGRRDREKRVAQLVEGMGS